MVNAALRSSDFKLRIGVRAFFVRAGTQDADDFAAGTRVNALAEEHGFIVAYPSQSKAANASLFWNWFRPEHQKRGRGEPAIIAGITSAIVADYDIDPARVFVAGLSAGGAMAAGCDLSRSLRRGRSFHGDADNIVHASNATNMVDAEKGWRERRACGSTARRDSAHTRTVTRDKTGAVVVEQWLIHGSGHAWSGGSQTALTPIRTAQTPPEKCCDSSLKSSPQGPEVTDATITGNNYK